jgi:alpha-galactosidase
MCGSSLRGGIPVQIPLVLILLLVSAGPRQDSDGIDIALPGNDAPILTPAAPSTPRINGPKVYGVRPGSPLVFRIAATGDRPMTFTAENLPVGLKLDSGSGIITGKLAARGEYKTTLLARNAHGAARRDFRIMVGDKLALTPPMGWNSWYIHYDRVSDRDIRAAADAMISSGMADYGYQYVNIDDCWAIKPGSQDPVIGGEPRDADKRMRPNKRFPDMKALTDHIHARGLKAGIYTSPGPQTCAGYEGSYRHEALDARTFAEWGFDFLKYDWCSYGSVAGGKTVAHLKSPYKLMWNELQNLDRDMVFNLCQYGMGNVWEWGGEVGHSWRTTGDLGLEGGKLSAGIYKVGLFNARLHGYAGPGRWNDPDYILIGWVGDAQKMGVGHPTTLTPDEQYSHMSMWSLMAAPLIFSGDMTKLDAFTLNILCNHEIIEIDQDLLGRQARIIKETPNVLILVKELEDGSKAAGLFNLGSVDARLTADWSSLGIAGRQRVRDLWRQRDLGTFGDTFSAEVPPHGVVVLRLWPEK